MNKVALDNIGEYVVFPSRWYHHGYYNIKSDKVFYTAQLFALGSPKPEAWQNITRKVNRNMVQGHVAESKLRELTEDLRDIWDTTYSVNLFPPSKEFEGEKIDVTKNRHILRANFGSLQRIAELVQLFEDKYKHLAIHSVSSLAQRLLDGTQGHVNYCGQCWRYYKELIGSNKEGSMLITVRVSVTSSIQNVEQLESVSLAKWGSAGCL